MKGALKAVKRTPHLLTSKVGMANKSSDAEFDDLNRRFTNMESYADKLHKDATLFRDSINNMIKSSTAFSDAMMVIFTPMGSEYGLESRYPSAAETIKHIGTYQGEMADLQQALGPEIELIESRILAPAKELVDLMKKIRKAITKRDHKLVDYDRFNNSYTKLRDKKEKSLSDEKNLFKVEQDFELAASEYEQHNNALKLELPQFFDLAKAFITPLFQSFYYMQLQVIYVMLEKFQGFSGGKFDMTVDVEAAYHAKLGDAAEQLESMQITKRIGSTAMFMKNRAGSTSSGSSSLASRPSIGSKTSFSRTAPPASPTATMAPPAYSPSTSGGAQLGSSGSIKRAPPPPPAAKPRPPPPPPQVQYCTALYDYVATAEGDLSFSAGDRIEIVQKTESAEDWWTGRFNGEQGSFPANYVQL